MCRVIEYRGPRKIKVAQARIGRAKAARLVARPMSPGALSTRERRGHLPTRRPEYVNRYKQQNFSNIPCLKLSSLPIENGGIASASENLGSYTLRTLPVPSPYISTCLAEEVRRGVRGISMPSASMLYMVFYTHA